MLIFISTPIQAQAGFLSLILGDDAYADTAIYDSTQFDQNLGTMALLQANVSSVSIYQDKDSKDDKQKDGKEDNVIDVNASVNIVSDNALLPVTGPMGVYDGKEVVDLSSLDTSVYVVRSGDTVSVVAEMFGVTTDTIYSANNMKKGDKLKEGDVLLILPFSGVEYTIVKNDTLQGIANRHKVSLDDILIHNNIDLNEKISIGDKLMIPGASIQNGIAKSGSGPAIARGSLSSSMPSVAGYFVNPVPSGKRSRGITSSHRGVDLAAPTGTPIHAAASGTVVIARNGYNGGFGNYVVIQHPNGTKTLYAHMSKLGTTPGAVVSQSEVIGYVGNTGNSRGSHLHLEVLGGKNPF